MSTDPAPPPARLGYLLKHAHLGFSERAAAALAPFGVDGKELAVLTRLGGPEPLSQQDVAGQLGVDRTTMVALVDALEHKELVVRRQHPADRRKNVVELTGTGRDALDRAAAAALAAQQEFLAPLGGAGAERFLAALSTLVDGPPPPERARRAAGSTRPG